MTRPIHDLQKVIDSLLGPEGCPWDREQTPLSLCDYLVEEVFELVEAIRNHDPDEAMEEVGDVLFLLMFVSTLYAKSGDFTLGDAAKRNAAKMIRRHPHVFGDLEIKNQEELLRNWEKIKRGEKNENGLARVFDSLPKGLPPLLRAYRINSKAARTGFTWESDRDVGEQLKREWREFEEACEQKTPEAMEMEFGDYLFTLAEYGRRKGIKANAALDMANSKFLKRFALMEDMAAEQGRDLTDMGLDELNGLWERAKAARHDSGKESSE